MKRIFGKYLRSFIHEVKFGDIGSIMNSYNDFNRIKLSKNQKLVMDYLKGKICLRDLLLVIGGLFKIQILIILILVLV